jgi:hypothetical protein
MTRSATRSLRSPLPAPAGRLALARPAAPPAETDPAATGVRDPAGFRPAPRTPHPPAVPAQPRGFDGRAGPAAPDPHPAGGSPPWADPIRGDPSPDRVSFGPIPATGSRPRFAPPPASRTRSTTRTLPPRRRPSAGIDATAALRPSIPRAGGGVASRFSSRRRGPNPIRNQAGSRVLTGESPSPTPPRRGCCSGTQARVPRAGGAAARDGRPTDQPETVSRSPGCRAGG